MRKEHENYHEAVSDVVEWWWFITLLSMCAVAKREVFHSIIIAWCC